MEKFAAGRLAKYVHEWEKLTSDSQILDIVKHCHIDLDLSEFKQSNDRLQYHFSKNECVMVGEEIKKLLDLDVIIPVQNCEGQILSPIFLRPKKNGEYRMVLNLKKLNEHIPYKHFKMETFENALTLITRGIHMASVDLRHAYYSIKIADEQQKYFRFIWNDQIYQFTCLANGVSDGPRIFTKLLKPVYAKLRNLGYINSGFIDDSLLCGDSFEECTNNVDSTKNLMNQVGFMINLEKSVFIPVTRILYLGNIIDSVRMIVQLPENRQEAIMDACCVLKRKIETTIREVAKVIGLIVASFSAVEYARLHYRNLEKAKISSLKLKNGNYDAKMKVTYSMVLELNWWIKNVKSQVRNIVRQPASVEMHTDASLQGWGASLKGVQIGGRWNILEKAKHINALELLAISYALKAFKKEMACKHVKSFSDNTTAVTYINNMGGIKSTECNDIASNIWNWCIELDIWLTCAHVAGSDNVEADRASRSFNDNLEWKLNEQVFENICVRWEKPDIDLFASRLNAQIPNYCSWQPDPYCSYVDAFTLNWQSLGNIFVFPPFSLLGRCLQKIREERAVGIVVAPLWTTQPWFSRLMELLVETPVIIYKKRGLLTLPGTDLEHPLIRKLKLVACKVSGTVSDNEDFQHKLQTFSCHPGNQELKSNIASSLKDGFTTVVKGKLIQFQLL